MTTAQSNASAEVSAIDSSARTPLLLLIGSAIAWLVLSGVLAIVTTIQWHTPEFLADCSIVTHGRVKALQESAFIYGWAANAGIAIGLWVLARLGGSPLRALNWVTVGALFWNLGLTAGLVAIAVEGPSSIPFLQLPRYVLPVMLVAYGAISIAGVLAWAGRKSEGTYVSHWFAVAALFLFPWLFSATQVMLLWAPVRGAQQAVVGGWFVQGVWALWLVPLALAGVYYVVPKITGRVIRNYVFWTSLSFWTLIVVGTWTGGRHLIGGPVPAWIPTMAIVSCSLLLFHYVMVFLNLRSGFRGGSVALKFIVFGVVAYVLGGFVDAVTAMRGVAKITQFTYFSVGQQQLALYGGVTMLFFGSLYYLLPRVAGRAWASAALVRAHYGLIAFGVILLVAGLIWAGWVQGHDLNVAKIVDGKPVVASFADIAAHTKTPLLLVTAAQAVLLLGNLAFALNFVRTVCRSSAMPVSDLLHQPSTLEASA